MRLYDGYLPGGAADRPLEGRARAELMADQTIDVVQVRINPLHPLTDICDIHARADLWGLGRG